MDKRKYMNIDRYLGWESTDIKLEEVCHSHEAIEWAFANNDEETFGDLDLVFIWLLRNISISCPNWPVKRDDNQDESGGVEAEDPEEDIITIFLFHHHQWSSPEEDHDPAHGVPRPPADCGGPGNLQRNLEQNNLTRKQIVSTQQDQSSKERNNIQRLFKISCFK